LYRYTVDNSPAMLARARERVAELGSEDSVAVVGLGCTS
jgi:predicted O-methyltransferase YrrM